MRVVGYVLLAALGVVLVLSAVVLLNLRARPRV